MDYHGEDLEDRIGWHYPRIGLSIHRHPSSRACVRANQKRRHGYSSANRGRLAPEHQLDDLEDNQFAESKVLAFFGAKERIEKTDRAMKREAAKWKLQKAKNDLRKALGGDESKKSTRGNGKATDESRKRKRFDVDNGSDVENLREKLNAVDETQEELDEIDAANEATQR
jgi:hypothetical protein